LSLWRVDTWNHFKLILNIHASYTDRQEKISLKGNGVNGSGGIKE